MKAIPIGKDDFKKLIETDCYYVDQTKLIEELRNNECEVVLFPRPRRFGKSLNISMLENFFDIERKETNKNLFKGLYIEKSKYYDELSSYPVIALDFKNLKQETWESVYNKFVMMIQKLYNSKDYIYGNLKDSEKEYYKKITNGKGNIDEYESSIGNLIDYLSRYYNKKVILLIDEYDVPIQQGYLKSFYENTINLIRSLFSEALKGNDNMAFAVMTGVLRVSKESIFSDLNNVKVCGLYNSNFGEYFGFKEDETKELLKYYGLELTDEVKSMYDGYLFNGVNIYNPWSILNYASDRVLSAYWINTSGNDLIRKILINTNEENKKIIENLTLGEACIFSYNEKLTYMDFDNYDDLDIILNLLFSSGYLTIDGNAERLSVKIPNNEVRELIITLMKESVLRISSTLSVSRVLKGIEEFNLKEIEDALNNKLTEISYHDYKENGYHMYLLGIFSECLSDKRFIVKSNREAGLGRYDVMIERADKSYGYIFEFKVSKTIRRMESVANEGLKQIKQKEYYQELVLDKVKDKHAVVIVFCGKKVIVRGN